jgi:hypothetical protein
MGVALPIAAGAASYALTRAAMSAQVGTNGTSLDDLVQRFYAKLFSSKEEYNRDFAAKGDAFGDYNKDHHHLNQSITINIAPDGSAFIQTEADHYAYGNNPPMVKVNRGSWLN